MVLCLEPAGDGLQRVKAEKKRHSNSMNRSQRCLWKIATHDSIGPEYKVMGPDCNENDLYIYKYIYIYIWWLIKVYSITKFSFQTTICRCFPVEHGENLQWSRCWWPRKRRWGCWSWIVNWWRHQPWGPWGLPARHGGTPSSLDGLLVYVRENPMKMDDN